MATCKNRFKEPKKIYEHRNETVKHLHQLKQRFKKMYSVYFCDKCTGWHIGEMSKKYTSKEFICELGERAAANLGFQNSGNSKHRRRQITKLFRVR